MLKIVEKDSITEVKLTFNTTYYDVTYNDEPAVFLDHSSRSVLLFREQNVVAKIDRRSDQNECEFYFNKNNVLNRHREFFPKCYRLLFSNNIETYTPLFDKWIDSVALSRHSLNAVIQEYVPGLDPYENADCNISILVNRLVNFYNISDWTTCQWGINGDKPILWDTGIQNDYAMETLWCPSCGKEHEESLDTSSLE